MAVIMIVGSLSSSLVRFRGELIESWINYGLQVYAVAPGNEAKEYLENRGVKYREVSFERAKISPFGDLNLIFKLLCLYWKCKPDYLFLYTAKPVIFGSLAAFLFRKCRVYSMITGLGSVFTESVNNAGYLRTVVTILYRIASRRNEKVFFQNPDDLNLFISLKIAVKTKAKIVNGSGVNLDYFYQAKLPQNRIIFLLIARLIKEKGIYEYIEAAEHLKSKYPDIIFRMIGWQLESGSSGVDSATVELWKERGAVEIQEYTDDVRPYIEDSSVYVLPSYREGTPRTVLEAMAMGRPIITTDAPGCRETVIEGVNGFLVPIADNKSLAEAMERFILDPTLLQKMGNASRVMAEEKYDVYNINREINKTLGLSSSN